MPTEMKIKDWLEAVWESEKTGRVLFALAIVMLVIVSVVAVGIFFNWWT